MNNVLKIVLCNIFLFLPKLAFAGNGVQESIDKKFAGIVGFLAKILFFKIFNIPFIILLLSLGGVFFTFRFAFINIKGFSHSINVLRGKYDDPDDIGEISHFQALCSALSATIGLGNIAGVAVAMSLGGPGAIFWMWLAALFGMCSKFSSCVLAQKYRIIDPKTGEAKGGPMYFLEHGLKELSPSLRIPGKVLAYIFAFLTIGGSLGGGNMFQANQTFEQLRTQFPSIGNYSILVGIILAILVGLVIIGGIKRIGEVASKIVPFMCVFYCICALYIILTNVDKLPSVFYQIFSQAGNPGAAFGGFLGVFITGVKRASFSNEAGIGSASIAHAAAKTHEPVREGIVAMIGPFIDTHIVCTMTAIVVILTGTYQLPELAGKGVAITSAAFESALPWFPIALTVSVVFFAFSTIISWSYYGEKATEYIFGHESIIIYKILYVSVVAIGPVLHLKNVLDFSDLMILGMAFPNIIGMILLSGKVKELLVDYWSRYKSGVMVPYEK